MSTTPARPKTPLKTWTWAVAAAVVAGTAAAAVVWQQQVETTNAAQASDVQFLNGGGGVAGFATATIASSGTSATLALTGIAGAEMTVTDLLRIQNTDASQAYSVTLSRQAAPHAAVEGLTFTVLHNGTPVATYDAAASAAGTAWDLPANSTFDIKVDMQVADGTADGDLGSMSLQFDIRPA